MSLVTLHKDYAEEAAYLRKAVQLAKETLVSSISSKRRIRGETREAFVNYDHRDGSSGYDQIMKYASQFSRTIKNINRVKYAVDKPYFARIDYKDDKQENTEMLYIGKMGLFDEDDKPLVIDWRAPMSSVYYEGRIGQVEYESLDGTESGEMFLKRQYTIEEGKLLGIMDVDITTTDTFLQAALGESKDNRLKDIVTTIQAEQNRIIRQPIATPLIVQGAAGSGKTTIALHRIAYLIYTYEKTFDPSEFLIIAPSRLFLNYISEVLPELGADQVKQSTFIDLSKELTGFDIKVTGNEVKLADYLENTRLSPKDKANILRTSRFKGGMGFKGILERYVKYIRRSFVPEGDFEFMGNVLMTHSEINALFMETLSYMPLYKRKKELEKVLKAKLKDRYSIIYDKCENYYDSQIERNRLTIEDVPRLRRENTKLIDKRDETLKEMARKRKTVVMSYLRQYQSKTALEYYIELITDEDLFVKLAGGEKYRQGVNMVRTGTLKYISRKTIDSDDLAAVLYLQNELYGISIGSLYKYVVIDEAQDFSIFQLWILKHIFNTNRFTLVGDIAQGIILSGFDKSWEQVSQVVFHEKEAAYLKLIQSYRTTIEIMDFANEIIKLMDNEALTPAKPVIRHGGIPKLYRLKDEKECSQKVAQVSRNLKEAGHRSIAVICKTGKSADKLCSRLSGCKDIEFKRLTGEDDLMYDKVIVLPAYMAKGLEFDAVIIAEAYDDYIIESELDLKLFYVAATRAMHELHIITTSERLDIINQIMIDVLADGMN